jgi:hypothetical protein
MAALDVGMFIRPSAFLFVALVGSLGCRGGSAGVKPSEPTAGHPAWVEAARALTGTWTCRGTVHGPGGASPSEVAVEIKPELDKAWLRTDFAVLSGEYKYKFTAYRTFDAASNRWVNVILDNMGGQARSSSVDGETWLGESSGPMGETKIKDTEQLVSPGTMNMRGQYSSDGQTWSTGYDLSCKT